MQSKLGLGGHTFIEELGNDSKASFEEQCDIVGACLDAGIRMMDTTYYQERIALGRILAQIGRRSEAEITAWNFFKQPGNDNPLVRFTPYESHHIDVMLEELQTDRIDVLVIHTHDDTSRLMQELELAERWVETGKVKKVGLGMARLEHLRQLPERHPVTHVLAPYNAFQPEAGEMFAEAKARGMKTLALSPFIRGWKLDEIGGDTAEVSQLLLRWVAQQPNVDRVIASMRRREWVAANGAALQRGPLDERERALVDSWTRR